MSIGDFWDSNGERLSLEHRDTEKCHVFGRIKNFNLVYRLLYAT